ncbi:alpha/beta hydrolase [Rhodococcus oxybenzonivorans]|uniref:Alpha/beta hydrolase n=1 Tax=Rhodococcus oxybenzonivorans TaxID=1990687 RepID=A0A2S2BQD3_9NOCA|nr:alpha/beta hydrolase [Rhodococcus oxybenzonivorans]
MRASCEALLQFGARTLGNFDCIDLHHCHAWGGYSASVAVVVGESALHDEGGTGRPILLLHGLMGSARTWRRQVPWLREHGHVYTFDAAGHGRPAPPVLSTEAFVEDLAAALSPVAEPLVVIGHSMGALHAWCLAAEFPEKVAALVLEDMAPDFRGRTADDWAAMISNWPQPFETRKALVEYFGPVAGQYFLDSFEQRDDGWYLHGEVETFRAISAEWGDRHFWAQWASITVPALLIEGEYTITPEGQMRKMAERHPHAEYVRIEEAGHLVHDDQPEQYRKVVEEFLHELT